VKEVLRARLQGSGLDAGSAGNLVREYLQASVLDKLQSAGAMVPLCFLGGTALRFLHQIRRYSEDLDFSLHRAGPDYNLEAYVRHVVGRLRAEGFVAEASLRLDRTVQVGWLGFPGLLHDLGISRQAQAKLKIKLEVDTNPPEGAIAQTSVVRKHDYVLNLQHHDRASLLAGKLHAVLQRGHPKGRDFYDLIWYLSDRSWPAPNLTLLNNALTQTGWEGSRLTERSWRQAVRRRLADLDWSTLRRDVEKLLAPGERAEWMTRQALQQLVSDRAPTRDGFAAPARLLPTSSKTHRTR
jgi:predicted nucleotidyltransferase component of viral defense system